MSIVFPLAITPSYNVSISHDLGALHQEVNDQVEQENQTLYPMTNFDVEFFLVSETNYQALLGFLTKRRPVTKCGCS